MIELYNLATSLIITTLQECSHDAEYLNKSGLDRHNS